MNYFYKVFTHMTDQNGKVIGKGILTEDFESIEVAKKEVARYTQSTDTFDMHCFIRRYGLDSNNVILIGGGDQDSGEYIFTSGKDIEDFVLEEYINDDTELNSNFFDFIVKMKKSEILKVYSELQCSINGDTVIRMVGGEICDNFIQDGEYEEIFEGNCKDFLESFNGKEKETGYYRFDDDVQLDFITK